MDYIDIAEVEWQARQLRAAEMRRMGRIFRQRLSLLLQLASASALTALGRLADMLRPLFAWNPQPAPIRRHTPHIALTVRANRLLREMFAWNPRPL